jgi:hypothetical protein
MFKGIPDGSVVERPDVKFGFFTHTGITFTHADGRHGVIHKTPEQNAHWSIFSEFQQRQKVMVKAHPPSLIEQRRRRDEAVSRIGECWRVYDNCQHFTSGVVNGVPRSSAVEKGTVFLFIAGCAITAFCFDTNPA